MTDDARAVGGDAPVLPLVLLVDDSALVREALGVLLEATGHRVCEAGTVREAIDVARAAHPDALLLDLTLPDGHGLDVLDALTDDGALPRATIALTGHDDPDTAARCRAAGCHDVLAKPVSSAALLRALGALL